MYNGKQTSPSLSLELSTGITTTGHRNTHILVTVAGVIRKGFIERVNLEIHLQGEENIYTEFAKKQDAKGEF